MIFLKIAFDLASLACRHAPWPSFYLCGGSSAVPRFWRFNYCHGNWGSNRCLNIAIRRGSLCTFCHPFTGGGGLEMQIFDSRLQSLLSPPLSHHHVNGQHVTPLKTMTSLHHFTPDYFHLSSLFVDKDSLLLSEQSQTCVTAKSKMWTWTR